MNKSYMILVQKGVEKNFMSSSLSSYENMSFHGNHKPCDLITFDPFEPFPSHHLACLDSPSHPGMIVPIVFSASLPLPSKHSTRHPSMQHQFPSCNVCSVVVRVRRACVVVCVVVFCACVYCPCFGVIPAAVTNRGRQSCGHGACRLAAY